MGRPRRSDCTTACRTAFCTRPAPLAPHWLWDVVGGCRPRSARCRPRRAGTSAAATSSRTAGTSRSATTSWIFGAAFAACSAACGLAAARVRGLRGQPGRGRRAVAVGAPEGGDEGGTPAAGARRSSSASASSDGSPSATRRAAAPSSPASRPGWRRPTSASAPRRARPTDAQQIEDVGELGLHRASACAGARRRPRVGGEEPAGQSRRRAPSRADRARATRRSARRHRRGRLPPPSGSPGQASPRRADAGRVDARRQRRGRPPAQPARAPRAQQEGPAGGGSSRSSGRSEVDGRGGEGSRRGRPKGHALMPSAWWPTTRAGAARAPPGRAGPGDRPARRSCRRPGEPAHADQGGALEHERETGEPGGQWRGQQAGEEAGRASSARTAAPAGSRARARP